MVLTTAYKLNHYVTNDNRYNSLSVSVDPASVMLMTEYKNYFSAFMGYNFTDNWPARNCLFVHNDGQNFLYIDGHAKWMSGGAIRGRVFNTFGLLTG